MTTKPYYKHAGITIYHGDCLEIMPTLQASSVDLVLCDLPYGMTDCKWDTRIDLVQLWAQYKRICKPTAAIVLTAVQPFTSVLVCSNLRDFKYEWVWEKSRGTGHALVKIRAMQCHESVLVFCAKKELYNPQKEAGKPYISPYSRKGNTYAEKQEQVYNTGSVRNDNTAGDRSPRSVVRFKNANYETGSSLHPTQKPAALMEYMVKTYTDEGMVVLDNCMGSGTTGVACVNTGRSFIGIEIEERYCEIAAKRLSQEVFNFDFQGSSETLPGEAVG